MMSPQQLTAAPAGTAGTAAPIPSAAQLAARIQIPRRLPPRYDGQPLQHLSHSSYNRFVLCPEDWRRRYMLGEKTAPSGSMFLGRQVDDAITLYYRHILDHGERLSARPGQGRVLGRLESRRARPSASNSGSPGRPTCARTRAFKLGLDAVELTFSELIPHLGEPVAVQRKVEYTLAPGLEWSVLCYLDLETRRPDAGALRAGCRRLQGQDHAADPVQGRPRLPARRVPRRALAGRRSRFQDTWVPHPDLPRAGFRATECVFSGWRSVRGVAYFPASVLDLDLAAVHQPGFRPFLVRGDASAYWTVYDGVV